MKLSDRLFVEMDRLRLSHVDRFVLIDAIRRWCLAQREEEIGEKGNSIPVRLRWSRGVNSAGLSRDVYRQARKRLCAAGLLDRCRDGEKVRPDGRAKVMRDWFVIRVG